VIVYIESNFVLEIALEQEQSSAARSILSLAENHQIELAYPSFVLSEPFESVMRASRERNTLQKSLVNVLNNLKRSEPHKHIMLNTEPTMTALKNAHLRQIELLHDTFSQLMNVGRCIHLDGSNFREALSYQYSLNLSPQDSIIYVAIVADLKKQPAQDAKCFLSRDRKAFGDASDPSIKIELGKYNCRYIASFTQGLDFLYSSLK
jgi:predicted nucleic acid-binding protein